MKVKHLLIAFFALQALPFLLLLVHPIWSLSSSFLIFPASIVALGCLYKIAPEFERKPVFWVTVALYILSVLWHGHVMHIGRTEGFLE